MVSSGESWLCLYWLLYNYSLYSHSYIETSNLYCQVLYMAFSTVNIDNSALIVMIIHIHLHKIIPFSDIPFSLALRIVRNLYPS